MTVFNIGQAAKASGISAKMIRYYESVGVIPATERSESGYRQYTEHDLQTLRFVSSARKLGFSLGSISQLVSLWLNPHRPSAEVKSLAVEHIAELDSRIAELTAMRQTLQDLSAHCQGNDRPDCPILEALASNQNQKTEVKRSD